jgi:hypothetical protein
MSDKIREEPLEEKPPIFSSWNYWYALVLLNLAAMITLFYLFTRWYE